MTPAGKYTVGGVILGGIVAIGLGTWRLLAGPDRVIKDVEPDALPQAPALGKTGYKRVDAILGKLQAVAQSTGIPLGLMVGWIAKESGGVLGPAWPAQKPTPLKGEPDSERGLFQLTPSESKSLGIDLDGHKRLSTDLDFSIDAGVKLIRHYQSAVNDLNLAAAPAGNSFYWRLVKLGHSTGAGQMRKIVNAAKAAKQAGSWDQLEQFALGMSINGPQPKKWFPFVDKIYAVGRPFGFGSESTPMVGLNDGDLCGFDYLGVEAA